MTCLETHSWEGAEPGFEPLTSLLPSWLTPRTGYTTCKAQYKVKMQGPLFKNFAFQVSHSGALA